MEKVKQLYLCIAFSFIIALQSKPPQHITLLLLMAECSSARLQKNVFRNQNTQKV